MSYCNDKNRFLTNLKEWWLETGVEFYMYIMHLILIYKLMKRKYTIVTINKQSNSRDFVKGGATLSPWWITGITDAEGNFSISLQEPRKCSCAFKITQKDHSMGILYDLQKYFKCGIIVLDNKKYNAYKFIVTKNEDLFNIILPHFDKYPLITSKNLDYLDFKKVVLMCKNGLHLINSNRKKIFIIKNNMNSKRSFDQRWDYHNNLDTNQKLNNEWVQAFIDGDGSFQFSLFKTNNRGKYYYVSRPILEIAQSSHEVKVLKRIKDFFGEGYLKPKYDIFNINAAKSSRSVNRYILLQSYTVIKFIDKYPMLTCKRLDYLDWKRLIELKDKKAYNTPEGLLEMLSIKNSMNKHRTTLIVEPSVVKHTNNLIISNLSNQLNLIKYNKLDLIKLDESDEYDKFYKFKFINTLKRKFEFIKILKRKIFFIFLFLLCLLLLIAIIVVMLIFIDYIYVEENNYLVIINNIKNQLNLITNRITELENEYEKINELSKIYKESNLEYYKFDSNDYNDFDNTNDLSIVPNIVEDKQISIVPNTVENKQTWDKGVQTDITFDIDFENYKIINSPDTYSPDTYSPDIKDNKHISLEEELKKLGLDSSVINEPLSKELEALDLRTRDVISPNKTEDSWLKKSDELNLEVNSPEALTNEFKPKPYEDWTTHNKSKPSDPEQARIWEKDLETKKKWASTLSEKYKD